jgi:hypothetical protein
MWIWRGVLNARRGASPEAQLTVAGPKAALVATLLQLLSGRGVRSGLATPPEDEV